MIAAKTISQVPALLDAVAAADAVPATAKGRLAFLGAQVAQPDEQIAEPERRMQQQHTASPVSQLLAEVPGIGPVGALSLALMIDPGRLPSGRHFAAWLGLVPKEHPTGGRQRLGGVAEGSACVSTWNGSGGGISRAGNERLRQLLVVGAMAVIQHARPGSKGAPAWLLALLERKPRKASPLRSVCEADRGAVALANTRAGVVWAMMATGEACRGSRTVAAPAAGAAA